mmetsp:Transcript_60339/g.106851  ORF Transcript_60339/g.106851 Transcript_60339/m.106851 type:complete len:229 (+) Transcript_60339:636-1322(+)
MLQTMASRSGAYLTVPIEVLNDGVSASEGTGMTISTLLAVERCLNCDFALIMYSIRLCEWGSTTASIHMRGFTWVFRRYDISSNSPSGGMNEMVRSFSKRASRTHWWNLISSISTALPFDTPRPPVLRPVASNKSLSFSPSLSSGMPLRYDLILREPKISERSRVPFAATSKLSRSTTSRKISFFRCLMPSERQETALVTAIGGLTTSSLCASCVMYSRRIFASEICG